MTTYKNFTAAQNSETKRAPGIESAKGVTPGDAIRVRLDTLSRRRGRESAVWFVQMGVMQRIACDTCANNGKPQLCRFCERDQDIPSKYIFDQFYRGLYEDQLREMARQLDQQVDSYKDVS